VDTLTVFISTFALVFINEFGDKTQFAAGAGSLTNKASVRTIYFSSVLALVAVSAITVFLAGIIPSAWLPWIKRIGGILLILYGVHLFVKKEDESDNDEDVADKSSWKLFTSHFMVVFWAEMGDKTQIATAATTVQNHTLPLIVFAGSASALIAMTTLTVLLVSKIPPFLIKPVKLLGVAGMIIFGIYMVYTA
jgi:putative Ca2+/H+ antiporter (TMEM165/GDT1 family)